jgi:hypothetical protein
MNLFDAAEAERRKRIGMMVAAEGRSHLLDSARGFAAAIAEIRGEVTSDDVAEMMYVNGMDYAELGNAAGSVFDSRFAWTGRVVQSRRPASHGRLIRVWRSA